MWYFNYLSKFECDALSDLLNGFYLSLNEEGYENSLASVMFLANSLKAVHEDNKELSFEECINIVRDRGLMQILHDNNVA